MNVMLRGVLVFAVGGCVGLIDGGTHDVEARAPGEPTMTERTPVSEPPPVVLDQCSPEASPVTYRGFQGEDLAAALGTEDPKYDRVRPLDLKTFSDGTENTFFYDLSALVGPASTFWADGRPYSRESKSCAFTQVLGFDCNEYERYELQFSAIGVHVVYLLAWQLCRDQLNSATGGHLAMMKQKPLSTENARAYCRAQQQWSWGRDSDADELAACVTLAETLAAQAPTGASPVEGWAHVCAAVVVAAPSLYY